MDPFAVIVLGGLAGFALALALVARPLRSPPPEPAALESDDDLDGLLEAVNARRRRRGDAELTADGVHGTPG